MNMELGIKLQAHLDGWRVGKVPSQKLDVGLARLHATAWRKWADVPIPSPVVGAAVPRATAVSTLPRRPMPWTTPC